jgi:putative ABC transport system permease protein
MKFLPLIAANLLRKKLRTTLTVGSFAVALFLFGVLAAIRGAFSMGVEVAGVDRLVIVNRVSIIQPLPIAYRDRLLRVPGVTGVTHFAWFGGVYQDEKNFFAQFAIDVDAQRMMFPEFKVPDDQWKTFAADKSGCIAGKVLAKRFGWTVGDQIPIRGAGFPGNWVFTLDGIYNGTRPQDDETQFWFHADYLEEKAPPWWKGLVGWYYVRIQNPDDAPHIAKTIDEAFANSAWETRTQTEKAMTASFVKQMGNIEFLILAIGSVVFFTLLLVTGNTMAIAVRERTSELAVLKAIGFSDRFVLWLVMLESVLIAALGGGIGMLGAKLFSMRGDPTGGMLQVFYIPGEVIAAGIALTVAVGVAAGILPALAAMRLQVIEALRRV